MSGELVFILFLKVRRIFGDLGHQVLFFMFLNDLSIQKYKEQDYPALIYLVFILNYTHYQFITFNEKLHH